MQTRIAGTLRLYDGTVQDDAVELLTRDELRQIQMVPVDDGILDAADESLIQHGRPHLIRKRLRRSQTAQVHVKLAPLPCVALIPDPVVVPLPVHVDRALFTVMAQGDPMRQAVVEAMSVGHHLLYAVAEIDDQVQKSVEKLHGEEVQILRRLPLLLLLSMPAVDEQAIWLVGPKLKAERSGNERIPLRQDEIGLLVGERYWL